MIDTPKSAGEKGLSNLEYVYEIVNHGLGIGPGNSAPSDRFSYLSIEERESLRDFMADILFNLSVSQKEMFNNAVEEIRSGERKAKEVINQNEEVEIIRDDFGMVTTIKASKGQIEQTYTDNLLMFVAEFSEMALVADNQLQPKITLFMDNYELNKVKTLGQDLNEFYIGIDEIEVEKRSGTELKRAELIILEEVLNYIGTDREVLNRSACKKVNRLFSYYKSLKRKMENGDNFLNDIHLQLARAAVLKAFPRIPILLYSPIPG